MNRGSLGRLKDWPSSLGLLVEGFNPARLALSKVGLVFMRGL